jgi:hypothetical protein
MHLSRPRTLTAPQARRGRAEHRPAAAPAPVATAVAAPVRELSAERRLRASGGPHDHATYACRCGAVFPASPTTSVSCPLCGVQQAW